MPSGFQLARRQADAYESFTSVFMEGSAKLLVGEASIRAGDVVLDLACGTGLVARHVIARVSPGGRVVGSDINGAMLAVAREAVGSAAEWVEAGVDAMPFDDGTFTHVICQQGVQFFPDPTGAMAEVGRVLRPGGTVLSTVWATPGHNPYIESQLELLAAIDRSVAVSVAQATPANADAFLRDVALAAGFAEVDVTLLEHTVDITDLASWFSAQTRSTPSGPSMAALDEIELDALTSAMTIRMAPYVTPGGHRIPFASYLLRARRDGSPSVR